ncbi:hypothetical protein QBC39DRAFT_35147 [Podospora conica]|nr:hypothetical protein QBC39DRAFT_35147 [Schizothecium conicum]
MNPPSIPPPPPPPPPLNIPPSRARLQLAARLAMNKRNAAAAAAAVNGSPEEGGAPEAPSNPPTERLRNPFADDEDDEDDDLSGSDDGDLDSRTGASGSGSGTEWPRQSWWRGMVRGAGRGRAGSDKEAASRYKERFGDGRDDDSSGDDEDEDMDDEEFGDFAMPEAAPAPPPPSGGMVSGIDPAREKILLKPTPMHPGGHGLGPKLNTSPFTSLWPFSTQSFGAKNLTPTGPGPERRDDVDDVDDKTPTATPTEHHSMDDLIPIKLEEGQEEADVVVRGEDGKKIDRAVEAKSRTSIEDPDDDGEVIVGRPGASSGSGVALP